MWQENRLVRAMFKLPSLHILNIGPTRHENEHTSLLDSFQKNSDGLKNKIYLEVM